MNGREELATEHRAFTTQGEVDEALQYKSVFGLWSPSTGLSESAIDNYAKRSLSIWCQEGGNCQ